MSAWTGWNGGQAGRGEAARGRACRGEVHGWATETMRGGMSFLVLVRGEDTVLGRQTQSGRHRVVSSSNIKGRSHPVALVSHSRLSQFPPREQQPPPPRLSW